MNFLESHFWYNKRQRNGILLLCFILLLVQFLLFFADFSSDQAFSDQEFAEIQYKIDSLKNADSTVATGKTLAYSFNPNYLSDFKAYQLGLTVGQIDKLFAFRKQGNFVNSATDFKAVTGISDSLLEQISPYFRFPAWTQNSSLKSKRLDRSSITATTTDLNKVTITDLLSLQGLDLKLAKRIVAYRTLLQGFSSTAQLYEVYDLDSVLAEKLSQRFKVIEQPTITKLNINTASFKEVLHTPYLDFKLTKKIFQYKDRNGHIARLEELKKIDSFPLESFDRIALYLTAE